MNDSSSPTLALAQALIARRSLTPADDGCQALIAARLAPLGFQCETISAQGVTNLWARRGTQSPVVVLAGHTDVVPTGPLESWTSDPFVPTLRDGKLYGRGAADMKTSLAAFVVAIEEFVAAHPDHAGSIALLITSDEEGPSTHGTVLVCEALQARGETLDYCIVGEPTSTKMLGDTIKNGRRGSLNGTLTVRGQQCHIAYPHLGRNPIHLVAPALAELASIEWDRGNAYFPPTSFQFSNIASGTGAVNVVPGVLTALFNFRFAPTSTVEGLTARVHEVLRRHRLDADVEWTVAALPFLTERGPLVEHLIEVVRHDTGVVPVLSTDGGTSDARFIATIAREVVEFGPSNATAHKVDEHIRIADLAPLSRIYESTLTRLLA